MEVVPEDQEGACIVVVVNHTEGLDLVTGNDEVRVTITMKGKKRNNEDFAKVQWKTNRGSLTVGVELRRRDH